MKTDPTPPVLLSANLPTDPTDSTDSTDSPDSPDSHGPHGTDGTVGKFAINKTGGVGSVFTQCNNSRFGNYPLHLNACYV